MRNLWPVLALMASVSAQETEAASLRDWPQWLGAKRDAVWREAGPLSRLPDGPLPVLWRTPVHAGYSGPSVAGNRVFVTDFIRENGEVTNRPSTEERVSGRERVLCLDVATGTQLWSHEYPVKYSVSYPDGPRTSPLVHRDKVYTLGTDGNLLCLSVTSGQIHWQKDFKQEFGAKTPFWGHSAHPLVSGDLLVCMVGGKNATVVAFNLATGKEAWRALNAKEPGYASPALAELAGKTTLLVWHPESLNALDPKDGAVIWSLPLTARSGMSVTAPLAVGHDIYVSGIGTRPTLVHVAANGASAKILWRGGPRRGITAGNSSPLVHDGILYGVDTRGRLIGSSFTTGEQLWSTFKATTGSRGESYFTAFLIRHGEQFYLFTERGDLVHAELTEDGFSELGRSNILEPTTSTYGRKVIWSHPAFARRAVFARNDKEIICVSLAARPTK